VWGSFERNTGTWCPFAETAAVEAAFQRGAPSIFLPTCFNATVHFGEGGKCYQTTPAVGPKPAGYRSVLRAVPGQKVFLHWWTDAKMFRLDCPTNNQALQGSEATIPRELPSCSAAGAVWQWCDLTGPDAGNAIETNWHDYDPEDSAAIEEAYSARRESLPLCIGVTNYIIRGFNGAYAVQHNTRTNVDRLTRRITSVSHEAHSSMRSSISAADPASASASAAAEAAAQRDALAAETCALCTERFEDKPHWPVRAALARGRGAPQPLPQTPTTPTRRQVRKTICGHFFHATCLQHITTNASSSARRCPMCRHLLERDGVRPSAISTAAHEAMMPGGGYSSGGYDQQEAQYYRG
jgi:hypothetical protein